MLILIFLLLLKTAIASREPQGLLCKLCIMTQERLLNKTYENLSDLESFLVKTCRLYEEAPFCKYFVNRLGNILLKNRINYFLDNNYFCSHYFTFCDKNTVEYDFDQFRDQLYEKYPKLPLKNDKIKVYKEFNILAINDIHIQTDYEHKTNKNCKDPGGCCSKHSGRTWRKEDQAGYWGSPGTLCDIPQRTFDATMAFIKNKLKRPTFIAVLGDNYGHNYFREDPNQISDINTYVYSNLRSNFTSSYILPVLGNHECDPVDNLNIHDPNNYVYKSIFPTYKTSINNDQIRDLTMKGFYTANFNEYGVKFISINSQIYDAFNGYMARNSTDPLQFFTKFVEELYESEKNQEKVIILSHIPIVDGFSIKEFGINLRAVLGRFKDTVVAFLSGHTHSDSLTFIKNEEKEVIALNYVSPSLTTFTSYNPSFRIYEFENTKLVDYIQYSADLDYYNELAERGKFSFNYSIAYKFREEYGLDQLDSPESFKELEKKILFNDNFKKRYVKNFATSEKGIDPYTTESLAICSTLDLYDDYAKCFGDKLPAKWDWKMVLLFREAFVGKWFVKKTNDV